MNVDGKEYAPQTILEVKNLRTGHRTAVEMRDIKFDQGLSEGLFTEKSLMRSRW